MASLLPNGKQQYFDTATGAPLVGGKLYTYAANTLTPKATYTNAAGTVSNANPIILDARGEASVYWSGSYDVVLKDSLGNTIYSAEDITSLVSASDVSYGSGTLADYIETNSVAAFDSIADLYDADSTLYTVALVKGYYVEGDGGGGIYYYDSGDTSSSDNGGSIIVAADTARWKLETFGAPMSVLQFGAKPDGATNAADSFNAALTALGSSGGDITFKGAFYLGADVTMPAGTRLVGFCGSPAIRSDLAYNSTKYASMLIIDSAYKIIQSTGCGVKQALIVEKNVSASGSYPMPFTSNANALSAIAAFAGTAIYVDGASDCTGMQNEDLTIIGFNYGIYHNGSLVLDFHYKNVYADCKNAFYGHCSYYSINYVKAQNQILDDCIASAISVYGNYNGTAGYRAGTGFDFSISLTSEINCAELRNCVAGYQETGFSLKKFDAINCKTLGTESQATGITIDTSNRIIGGSYSADVLTGTAISLASGSSGYFIENANIVTALNGINFAASLTSGYVSNVANAATNLLTGDETSIKACIVSGQRNTHVPATWTPTLTFGGGSTGITYGTRSGTYIVQDNIVHVTCVLQITAVGSSTGNAGITGLPYTSSNTGTSLQWGGAVNRYVVMKFPGANPSRNITTVLPMNSTTITLYCDDGSSSTYDSIQLTDTEFSAGSTLYFSFSYMIDR